MFPWAGEKTLNERMYFQELDREVEIPFEVCGVHDPNPSLHHLQDSMIGRIILISYYATAISIDPCRREKS